MRCGVTLLVVTITFALAACSGSTSASTAPTPTAKSPTAATALPPAPRRLASDPVQLADDLVADEQALRDPTSSEALLTEAAHRQQAAYRALGCHPGWDAITRPRIPPSLLDIYDRNVDAQRQFFGP
ncbi:MAG TPA: lytic transglycosylase domain-containing protein, partial [Mycobacterium sp.]|nr:lytic transglycosylase domain-containing protein [Mycobacterium sp.]